MLGPDLENATHSREVLEASRGGEGGRSMHYDPPIDLVYAQPQGVVGADEAGCGAGHQPLMPSQCTSRRGRSETMA